MSRNPFLGAVAAIGCVRTKKSRAIAIRNASCTQKRPYPPFAQRLAAYGKMLEIVDTDLPYVPLFVQDAGLALSNKYTWPGFTQWSSLGPWELDLKRS